MIGKLLVNSKPTVLEFFFVFNLVEWNIINNENCNEIKLKYD